jgi:hypothetical protein
MAYTLHCQVSSRLIDINKAPINSVSGGKNRVQVTASVSRPQQARTLLSKDNRRESGAALSISKGGAKEVSPKQVIPLDEDYGDF